MATPNGRGDLVAHVLRVTVVLVVPTLRALARLLRDDG